MWGSPEHNFAASIAVNVVASIAAVTRPRRNRATSYELGRRYRPRTDLSFIDRAGVVNRSWVCIYRRARRFFAIKTFATSAKLCSGLVSTRTFDYLDQMCPVPKAINLSTNGTHFFWTVPITIRINDAQHQALVIGKLCIQWHLHVPPKERDLLL
jgi:hypothetical protein